MRASRPTGGAPHRDEPSAAGKGMTAQQSAVVPIVLNNGERPGNTACAIEDRLAPVDTFAAYRPRLRYLLVEEQRYDDRRLAAMPGLARALFQPARSRELFEMP